MRRVIRQQWVDTQHLSALQMTGDDRVSQSLRFIIQAVYRAKT